MRTGGRIFLAALLAFIGVGALLPVLPVYVTQVLEGGQLTVGVVMGCYALSSVLCRPFAGRLSDARGRRPLVLGGLGLLVVSGLLLYVPAGIAGLIAARLVLGAGQGTMNTVINLWLIDVAPVARRGQMLGLLGIAVWGGMSLGPLAGEALRAHASYEAVWALAALAPLAAALILRTLPDARRRDPAGRSGALLPRVALRPGLALMLSTIGWGTVSAFAVLHLAGRGVGGGAAVLTAYGLAVVGTRVVAGRLPDVLGPRRAAMAGGAAQAAGLAVLALASSLAAAVAAGVVLGIGTSLVFPALALSVVDRAAPSDRGGAIGVLTSFFDVGIGIGGPLGGAVAVLAGYEAAFWTAAVCAAAGAALAVTPRGSRRRRG